MDNYNNFINKGLSVEYFSDYNVLNNFDIQYRISEFLSSNGYYEIYTNSIVKSSYFSNFKNNIKLINPLTEFNDTLRQSLFFSGLEFIICTNNLSRISILTKDVSNFSNPHSNIKFLFFKFLSSKKFNPNIGGFKLKYF